MSQVVPNTPLLAQEGVQEARIIIDATPPHNVFYLSKVSQSVSQSVGSKVLRAFSTPGCAETLL